MSSSITQFRSSHLSSATSLKFAGVPDLAREKGKIGNVDVTIAIGDMTKIPCDAYVVPEFQGGASFGGVGAAIARAGGSPGLNEYDAYCRQNGKRPFGEALLTDSGGGNSQKLLHVVSVGSSKVHEYNTVETCIYNALKVAEKEGLKTIVAPALGTGIIGNLTNEQSAKAMMSAINRFAKEGGKMDVSLVIYGDTQAFSAFKDVLVNQKYETAQRETGEREFDPVRWGLGIQLHTSTEAKYKDPDPK